MASAWWEEAQRYLIYLCLVLIFIGWYAGLTSSVLLATGIFLAWHFRNIARLAKWLHHGGTQEPPDSNGIWQYIFDALYRRQLRNRDQKKRLSGIVARFQKSSQAMPDAVVSLDEQHRIIWFNDAATRLLGLRAPQDFGQRIANLIRHPGFARFLRERQFSEPLELAGVHSPQQSLSAQLVPTADQHYLLMVRDVSRIRRLEQARQDFVANASHELRTPLTVVSGYLGVMGDEPLPAEWVNPVAEMQAQTERMEQIIRDLLLLLRLESNQQLESEHDVDVAQLIEALVTAQQERASQITFNLQLDHELLLRGNVGEIRSVAENLIINAINYTPNAGKITISWQRDGTHAVLKVTDTGIGIAPQHIHRLTERFYRVEGVRSRDARSSGLGLAIVKYSLQRHDARLQVSSKLEQGSEFVCVFPNTRLLNRTVAAMAEAS